MEKTGEELEGVGSSLAEITGGWNKLGDGEAKTAVPASRTGEWGRGLPFCRSAPRADQLQWPLDGLRVPLIQQDQGGSGTAPGQDLPPGLS